ncbi:MAG: bifunctional demethylmenaquinone methyltransferase/2-methoxy-6-polyprenyl-1,4-benzoquinol methylase UbiE [Tannerellaceae bacterium]|jgi:demethylmenaquinone methyltransferase/2-methoxy-6-polyprenyl-1,4-benzoquinol methylase|nr:bifunctional demethylmenaquinone methyltransferase/2-methoxy-6-polyprenyl-1,4-benzoquinol methylase UbiE [Tannerellaceae bacterium]
MACGSEKVLPYNTDERKTTQIGRMFDSIAGKYDLLNHTLSLGFDKRWRRKGIAGLKPFAPRTILDIATGTGDLAISMCKSLKSARITGADISEGMMDIGRAKAAREGCLGRLFFEQQNCLALTYEDCSFDAVTAAFGIRNFEDINKGFSEIYRVLKPGGCIMILELSSPGKFPMKQLYTIYSKMVIPNIGRLFSGEKAAYHYLPASVKVVPQGEEMVGLLNRQGFTDVKVQTFTGGICSLYTGRKRKKNT